MMPLKTSTVSANANEIRMKCKSLEFENAFRENKKGEKRQQQQQQMNGMHNNESVLAPAPSMQTR